MNDNNNDIFEQSPHPQTGSLPMGEGGGRDRFLDALNEYQRTAVEYIDGASLVIAGAGSGKTRVLTYKIAYLLTQGYKPWEIMALTFTNKAAALSIVSLPESSDVRRNILSAVIMIPTLPSMMMLTVNRSVRVS